MVQTESLTPKDQEQIQRKELARGAWREGRANDALLIIRSVLSEEMAPQVAAECYSAEAGFLLAKGDYRGALRSLEKMAPVLDFASPRIQGTFYNQRARAHRNLGDIDAALTDYAGAVALWQASGEKDYQGAAFINVAELYLGIGDLVQARLNIDHALSVLPQDSTYLCNAYDTKAKVLLADSQVVKALNAIERALELVGDHEEWQKRFLETKQKIKERLLDSVIPLVNIPDIEQLKVQVIRHALDQAGGSITTAAKMLKTSHQVVAYTADHNGLDRSRRKKSIIKHIS